MSPLLRAACAYPIRPLATLREIRAGGAPIRFAIAVALTVSVLAGVRAALMAGAPGAGFVRFGTSLFGFVLLPLLLAVAGALLGGKGRASVVAAALLGCSVPFLLADALWIGSLASLGPVDGNLAALSWIERAIQGWSAVLLVLGLAEAHAFSRFRAVGTVGLLGLVAVGLFLGARAIG